MKQLFLITFLILSSHMAYTQDAVVNDPPEGESELHAAINPTDTNNMVVAVQRLGVSGSIVSIYYTHDYGQTWNRSSYEGHPTGYFFAGDPVLSFDEAGNLLLATLVIDDTFNFNLSLILSESTDGGDTWQAIKTVSTPYPDKPWMAIDKGNSSHNKGNVYIPVIELSPVLYVLDENYKVEQIVNITKGDHLPSVVVNSDGEVFVSTVGINDPNEIFVHKINSTLSQVEYVTQVTTFPDYTFNVPDISWRFQPTAYLAVDNSGGTYDGRLYLSYTASEQTNPLFFDVFLTFSDDDGLTWSTPQVINSGNSAGIQQFYSSMCVNEDGVLIIDWYDRFDHGQSAHTDFYLGVSHDEGGTFTITKLSSAPSDFEQVVEANQRFGIGEYHQVVSTKNTAIAFWSDGRKNNGDLNVYFAKSNLYGPTSVVESGVIDTDISLSPLYPVPASKSIQTTVSLKQNMKLRYEIYNSLGQKMQESNWKIYNQGQHQLHADIELASGNYIFKLISDEGYFHTLPFTVK